MSKRKAAPLYFPVDLSAFGDERFNVLADEREESVHEVRGRFFAVAAAAYKDRVAVLSRDKIQLASGLPKRGPWFADQLVDVDLATRTEDGLYRVSGVTERLEAIEAAYEKAAADGLKGAEKRWGGYRGATESDGDTMGSDGRERVRDLGEEECGRAAPPHSGAASAPPSVIADLFPTDPPAKSDARDPGAAARRRAPSTAAPPWIRNELAAIYALYPRKEGKKAGMRALERQVRDPETLARLRIAVENYVALCERERRDPRHVKHWGTFANNWEDYASLDADLEQRARDRERQEQLRASHAQREAAEAAEAEAERRRIEAMTPEEREAERMRIRSLLRQVIDAPAAKAEGS